MLSKPICFWN